MSKCLAILCQKIHSTFFSEENQSMISTLCILCQLCLAFALQLNVNYNCDVFISTIFDSDISFTVHVFPSIANLQVFNSIHQNIRILNHCSIIRFFLEKKPLIQLLHLKFSLDCRIFHCHCLWSLGFYSFYPENSPAFR